ncbi:MAG: polyprenyl synthetase family protein [Anaerolineae bacterium]
MDIRSIFAPIESDLQSVEVLLRNYARAEFEPLMEVLEAAITSGGKRIRPALVLLAGRFYPQTDLNLYRLATAVELLHDATLIHDDLLDRSLLRRGVATISSRWSEKATVLAGDFLLAKTAKIAAEVGDLEVMKIISDVVVVICEGEIRQDFNGRRLSTDREGYYDRIYAKTASLFASCTESAAVLGKASEAERKLLRDYGYNLGMAFQIVDDVLDFVGMEREVGKPVGSDLRQGLATLPTIYFYEQDPRREALHELAFNNGHSNQTIDQVIEWIKSSPAIGASQAEAQQYIEKAKQALGPLPDTPLRASLEQLADYIVERNK